MEPIWKTDSVVASTPVDMLRTPAAWSTTSPSASTPTAAAGTSYRSSRAGRVSAIQTDTSFSFVMSASSRRPLPGGSPMGSFAAWSVSDPGSFGAGFGWWPEFGFSVLGIDADFPWGVVGDAVVVSAEQDEVVEVGLAAGCPVSDVVGVAHRRWSVAAGERTVSVADDQGGPDPSGDGSSGAAHVEGFATGAEDGGDDLGVTRQPPDRRHRHLPHLGDGVVGEPGLQGVQGDGDGESGGCAVGLGWQVGVQRMLGGLDEGVPHPGTGVAGVVHEPLVESPVVVLVVLVGGALECGCGCGEG